MKKAIFLLFFVGSFIFSQLFSQAQELDKFSIEKKIYKTIDTTKLSMEIMYPQSYSPKKKYPTIIFFFGGGWVSGSMSQFIPQANYFASREMISILVDYRIKSRNNTTPFDAARDAKSAIRYLRQNAEQIGIDTARIVAAGGSAGGHLAAVTGNIIGLEEPTENLMISSKPTALVLFNPVFDNGPTGYGFDKVGGEAHFREISPMHNIRKGAPPTIVFFGTKDKYVPVATAELYKKKMEEVGSRCELYFYKNEKHGSFNYKGIDGDNTLYNDILKKTDDFLVSLKYIHALK